jgi:hypothetical protein
MTEEALEQAEANGDYSTVICVMNQSCFDDCDDAEDLAEAATDALLRLSASVDKEKLGEAGACEAVIRIMEKFCEEAAIVEVSLGCVRLLCAANANQARMGNVADLIVRAMQIHSEGEATLQEQACLAVEALAHGNKENAHKLMEAGVEKELTSAKSRITNERNKTYPDRAAAALAAATAA